MWKFPVDADAKQFEDDLSMPSHYQLIDDYVLQDGKKHPFSIVVPGGSYRCVANFIEGKPIAQKLNQKGISAFILYYRTNEQARYPAPMDDPARSIVEIFDNSDKYSLDTTNYSIWGSSAGGHLTASFGTEHMGFLKYKLMKPRALVLSYPVITMDKKFTHRLSHDLLLGHDATDEFENFASIEKNVTKKFPPTYVWCGDADTVVNPENSRMLARELQAAGVPVKIEVFPKVVHGVGPGTGTAAEGWIDKAIDFWMSQKVDIYYNDIN